MALLDIVIPTKNRQATMATSARAMISALGENSYRIIIFDNSDAPLSTELQREFEISGKVEYFYNARDVDVIENFNQALDCVNARYAILIGDDDFVIPEIFNAVKLLEDLSLDCLTHPRPVYYWPDMKFDREFDFFCSSSLLINDEISNGVKRFDPTTELDNVCAAGAIYLFNLPAVYHALVRGDVLREIRSRYGSYVMGPSPDMSLAVALCALGVRYGRSPIPFSIAGASYNSAAGMGRRGDHTAALDKAPAWLPKLMKASWDARLPQVWNGYSVYAQSILAVAARTGTKIEIDLSALYRKMIAEDLSDVRYVLPKLAGGRPAWVAKALLAGVIEGIARKAVSHLPTFVLNRLIRMRPHFRGLQLYRNIDSPSACIACAETHISARRGG